jgi:hypothetical protein
MDDFNNLPETYAFRQGDGSIRQVRDPVYNCLAAGFYGLRNDATHYEEGEIIIYDFTPNHHLQPLNAAAGARTMKWLEALPMTGSSINIEDLSEATVMIAKNPKLAEMSPEQISAATLKIAIELKKRRDTTAGMVLPPMSGETIETMHQRAGGKPPAMMATRMLDPTLRGPGQTGQRGVIHEPQVGRGNVQRAAQPMSAHPGKN